MNVSLEDTLLNLIDIIEDFSVDNSTWSNLEANREKLTMFLDRFKDLPPLIRNQIYGELYKIQTFTNDQWGSAEHAFLRILGLEAIFIFKKKKRSDSSLFTQSSHRAI